MSAEIECRKCGSDLEVWNNGRNLRIYHCPYCGMGLLKNQSEALHRKTTVEEVSDMVRGHLLDMLKHKDGDDISADELAQAAWKNENCDGTVFYSNYEADRFVTRHPSWVDGAMEYVCGEFGDSEHYMRMKAECNDRFLVVAFICATERYLYDQLGIDSYEGDLSKERIGEIKELIRDNAYAGRW